MNTKLPPISRAFGMRPECERRVPYNKEICRAVTWWEKETGVKFPHKILPYIICAPWYKMDFAGFDYRNIVLPFSDIGGLFHELSHLLQQKQGLNIKKMQIQFYRNNPYRKDVNFAYFLQPQERGAHRETILLLRKFYGTT